MADEDGIDWASTTFEGNRREYLRQMRKLTFSQKLDALDEMTELAEKFQRQREAAMVKEKKPPYDAENGNSSATPSPGNQIA